MDFYEIYMINKLKPKYNKKIKGSMDISNISFSYKTKWIEYNKDEFLKDLKITNNDYGVSYSIDEEILWFLQQLDLKPTISIKKEYQEVEFNYKGILENAENLNHIFLDFNYNCIGFRGSCNLITLEMSRYDDFECNFIFRIGTLKKVKDGLIYPDIDLEEINDIVNKILNLFGIEYKWEKLYNNSFID